MRAVNLIPPDARAGLSAGRSLRGPGSAVVGVLGVALLLVTLYVLAANSVNQRQAQLVHLRQQLAQTQAVTQQLAAYTKFTQLAQARLQTVREIASSRFDWQSVLSDLSRVVPANTTLTALNATVSPTAGSGGGGGGSLRGDITSPAFDLQGCTHTQDDVARLMSRLRLIQGVTRVTLANAVKPAGGAPGASVSSAGAVSGSGAACGGGPTFDLIVFFQALPTVPSTPTVGAAPAATATGTSTPSTPSTTSTTTTSTPTPTSTTTTSTTPAPAASTTPGGTS